MRTASDIADWWDTQHTTSQKALDEFVDEYPGLFGVVLATAAATAMDVGKGTVDVLRFGTGIAEGTPGGVAQDALRALSIAGPVGKGAKLVKEFASKSRMMRLIVDPGGRAAALGGGGRCVFVSATQALRQTGQKAYVAVDDFARELGLTLDDLGSANASELRAFLLRVKARIGPVLQFKAWSDIERVVPHDGSVVSFGVRFTGGGAHRLYAFRDVLGRVKIMDRGGSAGKLPEVFDTLGAMAKKYGRPGIAGFNEGFHIKDVFLTFVGPKGLATLAMEVLATTAADTETTAQMFEAYKNSSSTQGLAAGKSRPIVTSPSPVKAGDPVPGGTYTVKSGDSLSKIAQRAYGNMMKFGVIYMANRKTIGPNPDLIHPGQVFTIPVL
jgi:hypothetical protein